MNEFNINKLVTDTLKPLGMPVFFVARKEAPLPCIIYNTSGERGVVHWDEQEAVTKYKVAINIFSNGNFVHYKEQIKKLLQDAGFIRTDIPEAIYQEDVGIFNQPMYFSYYKEI